MTKLSQIILILSLNSHFDLLRFMPKTKGGKQNGCFRSKRINKEIW